MAKKPRPDPFSEGVISLIYKWFFGPLIFYKPHDMAIKEWLEYLFDVKNREITRYRVTKPFTVPGLYYSAPLVKVQGIGYRELKEDDILWVRRDARNPDTIDVEFMGGQGRADQVFALNSSQWGFVQLHVTEDERKKKE